MWVIPGNGPDTVVLCHPVARTRAAVLRHAVMLHEAGYNVVAYDLRNHGDLRDVVRYVRRDARLGAGGLALFALSFSTWPALYGLRDPAVPVDAVICDSGPAYDIPVALGRFFTIQRQQLPAPLRPVFGTWLTRTTVQLVTRVMLGVRGWPRDLALISCPALLIASGRDTLIPPSQVRAVARLLPRAMSWTAPNAMHTAGLRFDNEEYQATVRDFLTRTLQRVGQDGAR